MKVSFEGIGESVVTFYNSESKRATDGVPVKMCGNGGVCAADDGERFFGVAVYADDEHAAVQTKGFAKLSFSGEAPDVGFVKLCADGVGGVKKAIDGQAGGEFLVLETDTANFTVGIML